MFIYYFLLVTFLLYVFLCIFPIINNLLFFRSDIILCACVLRALFFTQILKYLDLESNCLLFIYRLLLNMFLMYYLSEKGERIYTFKVKFLFFFEIESLSFYVESRSIRKSYAIGSSRY